MNHCNENVIDCIPNPCNAGETKKAYGIGRAGDPLREGMIVFHINVKNEIIEDINYRANGCMAVINICHKVAEMVKGKSMEEVLGIGKDCVAAALGGLQESEYKYVGIGTDALRAAINDYLSNETDSLKEGVKAMKICISSEGKELDSKVDSRFGRCQYFILVDTDTMAFEAVENASASAGGGAGIQAGQLMASKSVKAVLTGNIGPNAFQTLQAAGIDVFTGITGTVKEAVGKYKQGGLKAEAGPTVGSHSGMK